MMKYRMQQKKNNAYQFFYQLKTDKGKEKDKDTDIKEDTHPSEDEDDGYIFDWLNKEKYDPQIEIYKFMSDGNEMKRTLGEIDKLFIKLKVLLEEVCGLLRSFITYYGIRDITKEEYDVHEEIWRLLSKSLGNMVQDTLQWWQNDLFFLNLDFYISTIWPGVENKDFYIQLKVALTNIIFKNVAVTSADMLLWLDILISLLDRLSSMKHKTELHWQSYVQMYFESDWLHQIIRYARIKVDEAMIKVEKGIQEEKEEQEKAQQQQDLKNLQQQEKAQQEKAEQEKLQQQKLQQEKNQSAKKPMINGSNDRM